MVVRSRADELYDKMVVEGESFWSAVHPLFTARDMTRDDMRAIITRGLTQTRGSYRLVLQLFNMPAEDYKAFLNFLRKHQCHVPFFQFRCLPRPAAAGEATAVRAQRAPAERPESGRDFGRIRRCGSSRVGPTALKLLTAWRTCRQHPQGASTADGHCRTRRALSSTPMAAQFWSSRKSASHRLSWTSRHFLAEKPDSFRAVLVPVG